MVEPNEIGAFVGLDVGQSEHHARALTPDGTKVLDKRLPNNEAKLRAIVDKLQAKHGTVLVVVDQPASIGALPLAIARDTGCQVAVPARSDHAAYRRPLSRGSENRFPGCGGDRRRCPHHGHTPCGIWPPMTKPWPR